MKDKDEPRSPPSPESLARLKEFARKVISVPKAEIDERVREFRKRRRQPKKR